MAELVVRKATPADVPALAVVHVASWRATYAGLVPAAAMPTVAQRCAGWSRRLDDPATVHVVAELDGAIVGFTSAGPSRDDDGVGCGELYTIYLQPTRWGQSFGRTLHDAVLGELAVGGWAESTLWVVRGNTRARGFYEHCGWRLDGAERLEDWNGTDLDEVRYRRRLP